jgi:hypothetical protein
MRCARRPCLLVQGLGVKRGVGSGSSWGSECWWSSVRAGARAYFGPRSLLCGGSVT